MAFDLLTTIEYGGCSAKLPANRLKEILDSLPKPEHPDLLVGIDTHDDAGVFRISDDLALIQTTDFFPPICSEAYEFGQIAAANALSDVYAMGGVPITALNIIIFPDDKIPMDVYKNILLGGSDKVAESGAVLAGGHTIRGEIPVYGLSVTGTIDPKRLITNAGAKPGEVLILTKPIGTGAIVAGQRLGIVNKSNYAAAIENMKLLNRSASEIMQKYGVRCATDITGFGLLGHAMQIANASGVTLEIDSSAVPLLGEAYGLVDSGCIPGAAFRNQEYVEGSVDFGKIDYNLKMLLLDAQTSGGILMAAPEAAAGEIVDELRNLDCPSTAITGKVIEEKETAIIL